MLINEMFLKPINLTAMAVVGLVGIAVSAGPAAAQSYTAAPTPVYGSAESQSVIHYSGPGLPGGEAQQSVNTGTRHVLFDVAGYDGVIYSPVTPPYNSTATYRTYAGQPGNGRNALLAQSVDGAP